MSLERKMQKIDSLVNKLSDHNLDLNYQDKMKQYLKCKSGIDKCKKELDKINNNLESKPKKIKYNSLSLIEKKIENKENVDEMSLSELVELFHSTNKIVSDIEKELSNLN